MENYNESELTSSFIEVESEIIEMLKQLCDYIANVKLEANDKPNEVEFNDGEQFTQH